MSLSKIKIQTFFTLFSILISTFAFLKHGQCALRQMSKIPENFFYLTFYLKSHAQYVLATRLQTFYGNTMRQLMIKSLTISSYFFMSYHNLHEQRINVAQTMR